MVMKIFRLKVINVVDFPYPLPKKLFSGKQIIIPNDRRVYDIPYFDFRNNQLSGIRILEVYETNIQDKVETPPQEENNIIKIKLEDDEVKKEEKIEEPKKEKPLAGKRIKKEKKNALRKK
jgi:hypothetical protein